MSKISAKQRYTQLMSWLDSRPKKQTEKKQENESRLSHYKKKGFDGGSNSRQSNRRR
jgi:hypothetical protein